MRNKLIITALLFAISFPCWGQQVRIIIAGDIMGHGPQINAALTPTGEYDYHPCFRYIQDYVKSADLAIANLEVTLAGKPYTSYPCFSSPDALAAAAHDAGFDILTTANNHCLDKGRHGLERTLRVLDTLGIPHLGTYQNNQDRMSLHPMIVERNGIRLALLNYTYGTNGINVTAPIVVNYIDTVLIRRDLQMAKQQDADFTIVMIHWGIEYKTRANKEQEQLARWLFDHGVDAVIGGHPHVVQNATLDCSDAAHPHLTVYSMGNVVSNQRDIDRDGGIMVELQLEKRLSGTSLTSCAYMPYWVNRGKVDSLYQYYVVPSADAVAHPDYYQISGSALKALTLFDANVRARLAAPDTLKPLSEQFFERRFYNRGRSTQAAYGHFMICGACDTLVGDTYRFGGQAWAKMPQSAKRQRPEAPQMWAFLEGDSTGFYMALYPNGHRVSSEPFATSGTLEGLVDTLLERMRSIGLYGTAAVLWNSPADERIPHDPIPIDKGERLPPAAFINTLKQSFSE